ncbi:MAG TPA: hypothetical protein VF190_13810, partial [Rhodothermales bacterium]
CTHPIRLCDGVAELVKPQTVWRLNLLCEYPSAGVTSKPVCSSGKTVRADYPRRADHSGS